MTQTDALERFHDTIAQGCSQHPESLVDLVQCVDKVQGALRDSSAGISEMLDPMCLALDVMVLSFLATDAGKRTSKARHAALGREKDRIKELVYCARAHKEKG